MTLLPQSEIAQMRDVIAETFDGTAIIQTKAFVSDGGGGGTTTWTASGTVDCHLSPIRGDEREIADRLASDADWIVTVPAETDVSTANRVVISSRTFNVLAARAPRTWELSRRLEVNEEV